MKVSVRTRTAVSLYGHMGHVFKLPSTDYRGIRSTSNRNHTCRGIRDGHSHPRSSLRTPPARKIANLHNRRFDHIGDRHRVHYSDICSGRRGPAPTPAVCEPITIGPDL